MSQSKRKANFVNPTPFRMDSQDVIKAMKEVLAQYLPKGGRAVLYGSRARGDSRPDSDWDVLILLPDQEYAKRNRREASFQLRMKGIEFNQEINPITYSAGMWQQSHITPFHYEVEKDGKLLCVK